MRQQANLAEGAAHLYRRRVLGPLIFGGKDYAFGFCFICRGLFDTPKNRVVTSNVFWVPRESRSTQTIEEPVDTAQPRRDVADVTFLEDSRSRIRIYL